MSLTSKERAELRAQAHHLSPLVHVGHQGLTETLLQTLDDTLRTHELVKISLAKTTDVKPKDAAPIDLKSKWTSPITLDSLTEYKRFTFPRQPTGTHLCISSFFLTNEEASALGKPDVVGMSAVTVGRKASEFTAKLFAENKYVDYLYLHGFSVETAEALAEYLHKIIRTELGIGGEDATDIHRLFSQGYRGSRYSFGYPACPDLEDQTKLFDLLHPERIDITLTEEYHLEPEQSTTAIICHHPEARYFGIK